MKYVALVFVGEFGYELLNWQGVARKLRTKLDKDVKIVICTRGGLEQFYKECDIYVDISKLDTYQNAIASAYFAKGIDNSILRNYIANTIDVPLSNIAFIESNDYIKFNDLDFGLCSKNSIYSNLNLNNNLFTKIHPDLSKQKDIEQSVGFNLSETNYILVQNATRGIVNRSNYKFPEEVFDNMTSKKYRIIFMYFNCSRPSDSHSVFSTINNNVVYYRANSFIDQGCLIKYAKKCVFFTEGDFRSHIYIPPFLGKDVYSIAHKSVYALHTSPIQFWNKNVFKFGGQIIPITVTDDVNNTISQIKGIIES